jgi:hypothetical protein
MRLSVERLGIWRSIGFLWNASPVINSGRFRLIVDLWSIRLVLAGGKGAKP